jgi:nucleotide-binding universal stress UspA family protein
MSILCGTDFSERSKQAADVAVHFAARTGQVLHFVHAYDDRSERTAGETSGDAVARIERVLAREAERLRAIGAEVRTHLRPGPPDEVLIDIANEQSAQLIVVAALGHRPEGRWQLGGHAERLAQRAHVPVFVVRGSDPIVSWVRQQRPLRIMLGLDLSQSAESAMQWVSALRSIAPCEVTLLDLYWPPQQFQRLGLSGVRDYAGPHPEVTHVLERELRARFERTLGAHPVRVRIEPTIGSVGDRIAALAEEDQADLIVVGTNERDPLQRVISGSVSNAVLHRARSSVVCVPAPEQPKVPRIAPLASVLVPTDFSPLGDAAVALAYRVVSRGGSVHLVHITGERSSDPTAPHDIFPDVASSHGQMQRRLQQRLGELVPVEAIGRVVTQLHVLESDRVADAICQAAERLDAGVICLGTHGRSGIAASLLGSVSAAVLRGTHRPVLFAHKPVA